MAYLDSTGLSQQVGHIKAYVNNKISSDVSAINDAAIQTAWSNIDPDTDASIYAPLISPGLVGVPTAPTANTGTDNNQIATTAFVQAAVEGEAEEREAAIQNIGLNLVPLNGSRAMTGSLQANMTNYSVKNISSGNEGSTSICGANGTESGSYAKFYGMNNVDFPGWFSLGANNGTNTPKLVGKPDGTLTWAGKNIAVAGDYLPTSGGMLTGQIGWMSPADNEFFIGPNVTDDPNMMNVDIGWNYANHDGAGIGLRSVSHTSNPGVFNIYARDEINTATLAGYPNGQLVWSGDIVLTPHIMTTDWSDTLTKGKYMTCRWGTKGTLDTTKRVYLTMGIARDNSSDDSDAATNRYGCIETAVHPDGGTETTITSYKNEANSSTGSVLAVQYGITSGDEKQLLFDNKRIDVKAIGTNYIRYGNGLQICWGTTASITVNANADKSTAVTFGAAFKDGNYSVSFVDKYSSGGWTNHSVTTNSYNTTGVTLYLRNNTSSNYTFTLKWIAIGLWK